MEHESAGIPRLAPEKPGRHLYNSVRACFVAQGDSLHAYCRRVGIYRQNARSALLGVWDGPAAEQLRREICNAAEPIE